MGITLFTVRPIPVNKYLTDFSLFVECDSEAHRLEALNIRV